MTFRAMIGLIGMFAATACEAQEPAQPPPPIARMALERLNQEADGRPPLTALPDGLLTSVDISPDGIADWRLNLEESPFTEACSAIGCTNVLYVSARERGVVVHDEPGEMVVEEGRVWTRLPESACLKFTEPCQTYWRWNPRWEGLEQAPWVAPGLVISAAGLVPDGVDESDLVRVNISDDGVPDWMIDLGPLSDGAACDHDGCKLLLFVSTSGGYVRAFDALAGEERLTRRDGQGRPLIDLSMNGVELHLFRPEARACETESGWCWTAWRWDEASRMLVESASDRLHNLDAIRD